MFNDKDPSHEINLVALFHRHEPVELVRHKPYRRLPQVGDVYAMQVQNFGWILMRTIQKDPSLTEGSPSSDEDAYLVYIYKDLYPECPTELNFPVAPLLLMPPLIVSRILWTQGYCTFVQHADLMPTEKLNQHCFWIDRSWLPEDLRGKPRFQDEHGNVFYEVRRPCGLRLMSFPKGVAEKLGTFLRDDFDQNNHPLC